MRLVGGAVAALLLAVAAGAQAHTRGTSYSEWTLTPEGAEVRARAPQLELTRLALHPDAPDYGPRAGVLLAGALQLWSGESPCVPQAPRVQVASDGWVVAQWSVRCVRPGILAVRSSLLHDVAPSHLHFARVQRAAGEPPQERVLTLAEPVFALGAAPDGAASFGRYVRLGVDHILSGWDHLAFVLALILLAARLGEVAWLATGFTAAHSLTLAAAVLGAAEVREDAVEAVIGFSIALVAAENLWLRAGRERCLPAVLAGVLALLAGLGATRLPPALLAGLALFTVCYFALLRGAAQPLRLRVAVAFVFGLVHGLGFAGALDELRLPAQSLALGLLGFNAGVELGQVLVIGLAWPLLSGLGRRPPLRAWAGDVASACVCALGTFWFVVRAFG